MPAIDHIFQEDQATEIMSPFTMAAIVEPTGAVIKVSDKEGQISEIIAEVYEGRIRLVVWNNREKADTGPQVDQVIYPPGELPYLVTFEHGYGAETYAYASEAERWNAVVARADFWWYEDGPGANGREKPLDQKQRVEEYFDFANESYILTQLTVGGGDD